MVMSPEPVPDMVSTGTGIPGALVGGRSTSEERGPSILLLPLAKDLLVGERLAARCWGWRWNCKRYWAWDGIGVRCGERKLGVCA